MLDIVARLAIGTPEAPLCRLEIARPGSKRCPPLNPIKFGQHLRRGARALRRVESQATFEQSLQW